MGHAFTLKWCKYFEIICIIFNSSSKTKLCQKEKYEKVRAFRYMHMIFKKVFCNKMQ